MIRFTQAYYDVSFTKPAEPEMFFDKSSTLVLAKKTIGPDNPPAYVSTITYGRMLFVFFSANESQNRLVAALEAAQNAGFANLSTSIKKEDLDVLKASHITVLALGGGSTAAVSVLTGDALANLEGYLREGANFTPASPGYPISYTTKYLRDGTLARLGYSTNYVEHIYSPLPALRAIQVHFHTHGDDKDRDESVEMWVRDTPWKEEVIFGNWKKYTPAGNELAHDRWGQGDEWGDHTDQDFTLTFQKPIPLSRCRSLRWRLRKNPDSDSGSGWRMSLQIRGVLLNGSTFDLVGWPERLVGDGNQYDFYNEVFPCPVQRVGDR